MPFNVQIDSSLDQICIIFQPSAIRAFTKESYESLMNSETVFEEIFSQDKNILDKIFDNNNFTERADELEILLLKNLKNEIPERMQQAMLMINNNPVLSLDRLSKELKISETTLFRLFKDNMGQNPKSYLKTLRFRNVLQNLLVSNYSLTEVAYQNQYYDQAHFINDFKKFTGLSPKYLKNEISVNQKDLTWIYNKN
ncbi:helix-turn-helix transcriptional regulator [Elizabethkingia ursingii]|nr:helix-turn-helix transcriptional regulator [Elizabethkingia ursingii]MCL1668344.1 helix-turn-helix transcriptional regulator [Elizabethkingia ursingii]